MKVPIAMCANVAASSDRPLRLLALGLRCPDWDFLCARLARCGLQLTDVCWTVTAAQAVEQITRAPWDCLLISQCRWDEALSAAEIGRLLASMDELGHPLARLAFLSPLDSELAELFRTHHCDFHEVEAGWYSPAVGSLVRRTLGLHQMKLECERLRRSAQQRKIREQEEARALLSQQRMLLAHLLAQHAIRPSVRERSNSTHGAGTVKSVTPHAGLHEAEKRLPHPAAERYRDLMRDFIARGRELPASSFTRFIHELLERGESPRELLVLHFEALEEIVGGLGERGTHHVLHQADQFLVEMMSLLAEQYRTRSAA